MMQSTSSTRGRSHIGGAHPGKSLAFCGPSLSLSRACTLLLLKGVQLRSCCSCFAVRRVLSHRSRAWRPERASVEHPVLTMDPALLVQREHLCQSVFAGVEAPRRGKTLWVR